jgi:hypothetical protein
MTIYSKIGKFIFILFMTIFIFGCKEENHIDKYGVNLDSLKTLPDAFYGQRRGNTYLNNDEYMIWLTLDNNGDVKDIFKITDLTDKNTSFIATISKYKIDTSDIKIQMQKFLDLSSRFKFGNINVDKANKISFSYQDGLSEQYVKTLNDSIYDIYLKNKDFRLLKNGWFEYVER